jgi:hypothetical protein
LDKTKFCFNNLFSAINTDDLEVTYMSRILSKIFPIGDATNEKIAYAIAVCQTILNSEYEKLTISEDIIKNKIIKNIVSIIY